MNRLRGLIQLLLLPAMLVFWLLEAGMILTFAAGEWLMSGSCYDTGELLNAHWEVLPMMITEPFYLIVFNEEFN